MSQIPAAVQVSFAITKCECMSFKFSEYGLENKNVLPTEKIQFVITINMMPNIPSRILGIGIQSSILNNPEDKKLIAEINSVQEFTFVDINPILMKNGNETLISDQVLIQLISISISNLRGMYAVKLENTIYANAIVPVMDASKFLPNKVTTIG